MVGSPCNPRDSQESSPTPQFKSITSSVLSFVYSPTLISIHDYWKTIPLTGRTFVGKVMSLLFNKLSRLVMSRFMEDLRKATLGENLRNILIIKNETGHRGAPHL